MRDVFEMIFKGDGETEAERKKRVTRKFLEKRAWEEKQK